MVDLAGAAVVAVLTRAPSSGGKSRLFAGLGCPPDPALLTALLLDTVDAAARAGVKRVVAVEPASACDEVRALLPALDVMPQIEGSLGARMAATMRALFDRGARSVALIGSDLPDMPAQALTDAVAALDADPDLIVLGPASDGGYYLVAATQVPPVFDGVEWGSSRVLAQTIELAEQHGRHVRLLDRADDVDTVADLRQVTARRTRAWVATHELGG